MILDVVSDQLHGVLSSPLLGQLLVLLLVSLVQPEKTKSIDFNHYFKRCIVFQLTLQSLEQEDHLDSDHKAVSRWRGELWRL